MVVQPDGLIEVLLDRSARWDERDDAAMDLAGYDSPAVVSALLEVGRDESEHETILESVGESLGELVKRQSSLRSEVESQLSARALVAFKLSVGP